VYGYYLFLGRGDWGTSRAKSLDPTFGGNVVTRILGDWGMHRQGTELADAPQWSSSWDLRVWKHHVDFLVDRLGADTLSFCMGGYELPYASETLPEAVELDHANVKADFFQQVIDHARGRGLSLVALFPTTGHAVGYARAHPEVATVSADGRRSSENLCHNHPAGRRYAQTVVTEVLTRYRGFDRICFHPPENAVPCHCAFCRKAFEREAHKPMADATEKEVSDFFWSSCMRFQREMEQVGLTLAPQARLLCITIPGRFEQDFDLVAGQIPRTTQILHWDYWSYGERTAELLESLRIFGSRGHRVGFIPSSGWGLDKCGDRYGQAVVEQVRAVRAAGIEDLLYFVGAIWHEESLLATSWKCHGRDSGGCA